MKTLRITKHTRSISKPLSLALLMIIHTSSANADPGASRPVIEEVMVTATKRASSLQDTGIAISVLDSEDLTFRDINSVEDLDSSVPGMKVGTVLGTPLINIRGVGLNFLSGLGNPGVATHADGVYLTRTGSVNAASVDIERVEVLRGPQGTLYGRNATGGSVNFISKRPAEDFGAGLTVGGGDYGREIYEGYVEGPVIGDSFGARLFWREDHFDGYGENETSGKSIGDNAASMGHLALAYAVNDALDLSASYVWRHDEGSYPYSTAATSVRGLFYPPGLEFDTSLQTFEPYNIKGVSEPSSEKTTEIANVTASWNVADYTFKSITGYVTHERDEYGHAPEIEKFMVDIFRNEDSEAWSQEFNLSNGSWLDGRLNWLIGAYYQVDEGRTPYGSYINLGETAYFFTGYQLILPPESETRDTSKAVFIDGYYAILDNLRFVFGIRESRERREFTQTFQPYVADFNFVENTLLTNFLTALIESCDNLSSEKSFSSTDPKLGIEWEISDGIMAYAQYQTGFKAGGFDTSTGCEETYEPEEIEAYELGIKATLLDGNLTLNAAAFNYDYTDYQVEKVEGFQSVIENAAAATSQGFEIEATYTPATWLAIDTQYSYLDATYDEYFARDNFLNTSVISNDAPIEDLSGNTLSRSPKNSVNLGLTFFYYLGQSGFGEALGLGNAQFRIEGFYSDEVHFREFNRSVEVQDAYSTYSAFLSVSSRNEMYSLSVFAKNIGDERYAVGQIPFDSVQYRGIYYAPPRTLGATLSIKFQ